MSGHMTVARLVLQELPDIPTRYVSETQFLHILSNI